jgi:hypothetical protein
MAVAAERTRSLSSGLHRARRVRPMFDGLGKDEFWYD